MKQLLDSRRRFLNFQTKVYVLHRLVYHTRTEDINLCKNCSANLRDREAK